MIEVIGKLFTIVGYTFGMIILLGFIFLAIATYVYLKEDEYDEIQELEEDEDNINEYNR